MANVGNLYTQFQEQQGSRFKKLKDVIPPQGAAVRIHPHPDVHEHQFAGDTEPTTCLTAVVEMLKPNRAGEYEPVEMHENVSITAKSLVRFLLQEFWPRHPDEACDGYLVKKMTSRGNTMWAIEALPTPQTLSF